MCHIHPALLLGYVLDSHILETLKVEEEGKEEIKCSWNVRTGLEN